MTVRRPSRRVSHLLGGAVILMIGLTGQPAHAAPQHDAQPLAAAFDRAAAGSDVPRDLLAALGYAETRLDGHGGQPSASGGYGVMHLTSNPKVRTLDEAARRTRLDRAELRTRDAANVAGAAAVLRSYADEAGLTAAQRDDVNQWYGPIARYGGSTDAATARLYADAVYDLLARGFIATTAGGEVSVDGRPVAPQRGRYAAVAPLGTGDFGTLSTDYGPAAWVPANSSNYTVSSRESAYPINYIVIHTMQGSYAGSISWFQNAAAGTSAHYLLRSSDGAVTQMVRDKDIAWHAGNWTYNTQSIGIEHEGYVDNASWYTDAMYRSSAALTRFLCDKYGIPKTRTNIIGHNQVPGATHTDPGSNWNWTYYMQLVTGGTTPPPTAWSTIVDNTTAGRFTASANWGTSTYSAQRYGADYRYANPVAASDTAWYKVNIPATATYRVEVWYPAVAGYNTSTPYIVATTSGNQTVAVNQSANGGAWRSLGTFTLAAGDANKVGVSRWSGSTGYVIADAIRVTRV
ncbi:N-acetylmuramoyl-L-alanine amidase [Micromonospora sp. R42106]|nr:MULTISPECIES: N-acetylmuramoyl-L-alanine amidase [unclassified Micromonospora]MCK1809629.1 N-acetylmuramoyl-L-alanine amidase [Micromonospora sp. R42106]MCK1834638.1 N-acetylmuramoyl-L-alanine amidase [Micromonospora sp. R42003]MCK1846510.1 N-acetylmuramoyl-L-alanine amidase [Micromonospora sp. R42004]MCM1015599.1 N-acetylmuramoyl-L-alanine amidase [Micromonospora sp. XM-20-01]